MAIDKLLHFFGVLKRMRMTKNYQPSHDIDTKAGRRINWKRDLAIGHKRRINYSRFFRIIR